MAKPAANSRAVVAGALPKIMFQMANHGATTVSATLAIAHQRTANLEHAAPILFDAHRLGRVTSLTDDQLRDLTAAREVAWSRDAQQTPPWARRTE